MKYELAPQTIVESSVNRRLESLEKSLVNAYDALCYYVVKDVKIELITEQIKDFEKYHYTIAHFYSILLQTEEVDKLIDMIEILYQSILEDIYPMLIKLQYEQGV